MPLKDINQQNFLTIVEQQSKNKWLVDHDNVALLKLIKKNILEIENIKSLVPRPARAGLASDRLPRSVNNTLPKILLIESKPIDFIACFLAAIITKAPIFLGNPDWQPAELKQVKESVKPDVIWHNNSSQQILGSKTSRETVLDGAIAIATGGSSGKIRFAIHTIDTLTASVRGFREYFATPTINCCCILPLYHISGLIQLWRSLLSGGNLAIVSYENLKQNITPTITPQNYFLSVVPTQLQFLLDCNPNWLGQFRTVLLGGAPSWKSLLEKARQHQIAISTTYGMTETASGISYLKPQDFLQGNCSSGQILPHAKAVITNHHSQILEVNRVGTIKIESDSLYHGYYGKRNESQKFIVTDDLGFIDTEGFLHIVGRNSRKIITGGENVYPQEVEAAILATGLVKDICVVGLKDNVWGQAVSALFVPVDREVEITEIQQHLQQQLSKYKQPKHWLATDSLLRDSKGKLNYSLLTTVAQELLAKKNRHKIIMSVSENSRLL